MTREFITGPGVPPAQGPYSPAVKVAGLVFVSAQTGLDPATGRIPEGGFEAECRQAFSNVAQIMKEAGGDLSDVVKVTVLYARKEDLPILNTVFQELFGPEPPARTAAVVTLAGGRSVAVDATAVLPRP